MRIDSAVILGYIEHGCISMTLSDSIRAAIKKDGRSLYALAIASGVDRGVLVRFMNGDREPTLPTADKICRVLGLELRQMKKPRKGG